MGGLFIHEVLDRGGQHAPRAARRAHARHRRGPGLHRRRHRPGAAAVPQVPADRLPGRAERDVVPQGRPRPGGRDRLPAGRPRQLRAAPGGGPRHPRAGDLPRQPRLRRAVPGHGPARRPRLPPHGRVLRELEPGDQLERQRGPQHDAHEEREHRPHGIGADDLGRAELAHREQGEGATPGPTPSRRPAGTPPASRRSSATGPSSRCWKRSGHERHADARLPGGLDGELERGGRLQQDGGRRPVQGDHEDPGHRRRPGEDRHPQRRRLGRLRRERRAQDRAGPADAARSGTPRASCGTRSPTCRSSSSAACTPCAAARPR